jgi:hypothetical protein
VYGVTKLELENEWRDAIGAPRISEQARERLAPTPIPRRTFAPYSLTPQPGSQAAPASVSSPEPVEGSLQPQEVATPTAEPTTVPEPSDTPTAAPSGSQIGVGCGLPSSPGAVEGTMAAALVGLAGLGARGRLRGRG